jgi:hypothetical protein
LPVIIFHDRNICERRLIMLHVAIAREQAAAAALRQTIGAEVEAWIFGGKR